MMIPVEVQPPCKPDKARYVGTASDDSNAESVAKAVGIPEGCFIDGKIMKGRKKPRRWSLVADVTFTEYTRGDVCPHCGEPF
jgi:rRNA maturation endonuclease Nob1